jgi:hypothetical protein
LILQEYIATRPGEDLRVWVVGGRVLGAMRRRSTDGSFKANISRGGDGEPFPLNSAIEALALASAAAVNLEIAGVDLLFDGEGYCVFNDVAIAIRDLQMRQPGIKVMVVDTDAHQGNGTASLLGDDPRVFTYSIHVGRNYPTKKVASTLDVETVRYVEGEMYLQQLFKTLADSLDSFSPDLVIWISGADNHRNDRFGQMHLSLKEIQRRDEVLLRAMIRNRIKPYYLHSLDPAPGTARFQVPEAEGLALMAALRGRLPGHALPLFVCETPMGGGKKPVE